MAIKSGIIMMLELTNTKKQKMGIEMALLYKFRKSIIFFLNILSVICQIAVFLGVWSDEYSLASFQLKGNYVVIMIYGIMLLLFLSVFGGLKYGTARLHDIVYSNCLSLAISGFFTYFEFCLIARKMLSPIAMIVAVAVQCVFSFIYCYCINTIYYIINKVKNVIVVSTGSADAKKFTAKMKKITNRYNIDRGISPDKGFEAVKQSVVDYDAVLVCDDFDKNLKDEIIKYCYSIGKKVYVQPSTADIIVSDTHKLQISDSPLLVCKTRGLTKEQALIKRIFDLLVAVIGIILSSPIMAAVAVAIKINDGGPVLFKQNRVTENGKIFNVYKFRSMIVDADKDGAKKATVADDRITAVGKIIRPLRLDELPQLFNVLFGTMSIVGPRPERTENVHEYTSMHPEFVLRHRVKGGITGYAQVYGKYNTSPLNKLHLDLMYIENYSFLLDIKLIIMTFKILFVKESSEGFDEEANENVKKPNVEETKE